MGALGDWIGTQWCFIKMTDLLHIHESWCEGHQQWSPQAVCGHTVNVRCVMNNECR